MEKQFAASEVRRLSNRIPRSNDEIADAQEALRAFADLLEAREKAVPVEMTQQFTASEVRELAKHMESVGWRPDSNGDPDCFDEGAARSAEMLFAFADLLEAQERAVPVGYITNGDVQELKANRKDKADGVDAIEVLISSHPFASNHIAIYAHTAPADAERLAEALRELVVACEEHDAMVSRIIGHPAGWNAQYLNSAREALAAHSAQAQPKNVSFVRETWTEDADCDRPNLCTICGKPLRYGTRHTACAIAQSQPPAASVPEALRLLQSVLCDTDGNCCIRGTYEDRRTVDKALAMLAAQEKPNG